MKRVAIIVLILSGLFSSSIHAQISRSKSEEIAEGVLSRLVEFNEINDTEFVGVFARALSTTRVPGGIVKIDSCNAVSVLKPWRAHIFTLREALDSIVQAEPDYNWSMDDGVVNLTPKSEEPALLQTRISALKVKNARSIYLPLGELMALPEVRESIARLGLSQAPLLLIGVGSLKPNEPGYTIDCQNVTLKEAFNTIVRAHGRAVWRYKETRCNGKTEYSLDFVVE
jgi:hypothetical protein